MADLFSSYKPLRNYLRSYNLWSGLKAANQFMQFLDFGKELPAHFKNPTLITRLDWMRRGVVQWEFETLIREMILNCPERGGAEFTHWNQISKAINHIKRIENDAYAFHERQDEDILYELVRIAHRQFPWQTGINQDFIARYHWLHSQDGLAPAIFEIFGMSVTELFQLSLGLSGHFMSQSTMKVPVSNGLNSASPEMVEQLIGKMSVDLAQARKIYRESAEYNVNWAYTFNLFRDRPLLRVDSTTIFCPINDFLIRRVTSGLYFDLISKGNTGGRHLGPAVQKLIGLVAQKSSSGHYEVMHEREYGGRRNRKDTIDWIVADKTAHLFVEAKAARVRFRGMSDLINREEIRAEFDRVRKFAVQAYVTISDALRGKYPHWSPDDRPCFLTIVTLEDWQAIGFQLEREVLTPLASDLDALGIDPDLPNKIPMSFCHVSDFEAALHVASKVGLKELLSRKSNGEHKLWHLGVFVGSQFGDELSDFKPLTFADEWKLLGAE